MGLSKVAANPNNGSGLCWAAGCNPGIGFVSRQWKTNGLFLKCKLFIVHHCFPLLVIARQGLPVDTKGDKWVFLHRLSLSLSLSARHCLSLLAIPRLHRWSELAGWQMNCSMFMYNCNHYFILCHFPLSLSTIPYTASKNYKAVFLAASEAPVSIMVYYM